MHRAYFISLFLIFAGASLLLYTAKMPVYTDPSAPDRISNELYPSGTLNQKERDARYEEWFSRLRSFETQYKRLSDLGRSLCASGVGFLLASALWIQYPRQAWLRTTRTVLNLWFILWAVRFPLSVWYYGLREYRVDYPSWDDSIGIPIFFECIEWAIGLVISSRLLRLSLKWHTLPATISWVRPSTAYGWFRIALFALWIAFLIESLIFSIPDGDEGAVFTSIVATVVLLIFLSADEVTTTPLAADPSTSSG